MECFKWNFKYAISLGSHCICCHQVWLLVAKEVSISGQPKRTSEYASRGGRSKETIPDPIQAAVKCLHHRNRSHWGLTDVSYCVVKQTVLHEYCSCSIARITLLHYLSTYGSLANILAAIARLSAHLIIVTIIGFFCILPRL